MIAVLLVLAVVGLVLMGTAAVAIGALVGVVRRHPVGTILAGAAIGLLVGGGEGGPGGAIAGLVLAAVLVLALRSAAASRAGVPPQVSPIAGRPPTPLDRAWTDAAELAGSRLRPRLVAAHARCAALLAQADAAPGDLGLHEWAQVIRCRVPELVDAARAAIAEAPAGERAGLTGELVLCLDQIAAEAEERTGGPQRAARDRFATMRAYVADRTARTRGP